MAVAFRAFHGDREPVPQGTHKHHPQLGYQQRKQAKYNAARLQWARGGPGSLCLTLGPHVGLNFSILTHSLEYTRPLEADFSLFRVPDVCSRLTHTCCPGGQLASSCAYLCSCCTLDATTSIAALCSRLAQPALQSPHTMHTKEPKFCRGHTEVLCSTVPLSDLSSGVMS